MSRQRKAWFCQDCRVIMTYDTKMDFYKCPECGVEVWPFSKKDNDEISNLMHDMAHVHEPREVLPAGKALPGSSSKSKSRSRKSDMKKKSLSQINAGLAGTCAAFNS